jgi:hypothetical protein
MSIQPTLLFSGLFSSAVACIYWYVGWRLGRRIISSDESRLAWQLFTIWWYGLAATTLASGLQNLLGALGITDLPIFVTLTYVNILVVCIALWGLLYYLIYLFTGNDRTLGPLTVFYILYYILLVYYITASSPNSISIGRWSIEIVYRSQITGPFFVLVLLLLILPQMIGSLFYFSLFFRVKDVTQKYRILLVSWSIFIWFGSALAASASRWAEQDWWQLTSRLIGLVAALAILQAYIPVHWLIQRYGITPIDEKKRSLP